MEAIKQRMSRWARNVAYIIKVKNSYIIFRRKVKGGDKLGE
jgi:hypothetical protein